MKASIYLSIATLLGAASAYNNNCKGSIILPDPVDCAAGIGTLDPAATYTDQSQFSSGSCYIIYATNGSGDEPVSGQTILDTYNNIRNICTYGQGISTGQGFTGSYGTGNCVECHVTVNYRS